MVFVTVAMDSGNEVGGERVEAVARERRGEQWTTTMMTTSREARVEKATNPESRDTSVESEPKRGRGRDREEGYLFEEEGSRRQRAHLLLVADALCGWDKGRGGLCVPEPEPERGKQNRK